MLRRMAIPEGYAIVVVVVRVADASRLEPVPCQTMRTAQQSKIKKAYR